ncbi:MAG: ShlB/FhaC/HecB family hemolysin secretion/activation protein [Nitrosomonas sp.]|nr:ShlB/FhaC/HecB family hemolysin secretion/activation protein [Nitrosomonas sp.]
MKFQSDRKDRMVWKAKNFGRYLIAILLLGFVNGVQGQTTLSNSAAQGSFFIKTIQIQGNTLLPESKLSPLVAHLTQSEQALDTLKKGAEAIQKMYRDAGYGGVVAFIPEQKLDDGNVVIQVLEGKLTAVQISGNENLDEANILASLPHLQKNETPVIRDIDRNIQMANENPAKNLRVSLTAGARPGGIDADVKVSEQRPLRLLFGADSAGTPGTGNFRTNFGIQHANLWNRDHIGTFQFQTSPTDPGRAQIYSVGYRIPLYNYFSAVDAFYAHSNVESVTAASPANILGFTGKGDVAGFRAHRYLPRLGEYDHRVTFGWDWRHFNNNCTFGVLGSAACGNSAADVTITPLSMGYSGQVEGPRLSWGVNTSFAGNVGGSSESGFNVARIDAEKHYVVWRFFGFTNVALPAGFGLAARIAAQYSPHALVPGEQFGLGGGGSAMGGIISVRGYREREVVGDYGTTFNIEGLGPDFAKFANSESYSLRPLVFFDVGWAGNNYHFPCTATGSSCTLAGVGGGIRFAIGKRISGRLDFGHALIDGNQKMAGTTRGHLAVNIHY